MRRNGYLSGALLPTIASMGLSLPLACGGTGSSGDTGPARDSGAPPVDANNMSPDSASSPDCTPPSTCGGNPSTEAGPPPPNDGDAQAILNTGPGWTKIPKTALCGGPDNTTLSVPNNFPSNLDAGYSSYGFPFSDTCYDEYEDSSTAIVDTSRNRLIFWGGGHNGYWGNDVYELDVNAIGTGKPVLLRLTNPANPNVPVGGTNQDSYETLNPCSYAPGCTPTTETPASRHTYNDLVYLPASDQMLTFGGALTPKGYASSTSWLLGMSSVEPSCAPNCDPAWTNLHVTNVTGSQVNLLNYDPNTGGVWMFDENGSIWFYTPSTQSWAQHGTASLGYHSYSVLDPQDKVVITVGGTDGLHYFDISDPSNTTLTLKTPTTSGCSGLLAGTGGFAQYPGLVWDSVRHQVVAYPNGGNVLYVVDPTTWTCTPETHGSTQGVDYPQDTPINSGDMGTFGHFAYVPAYDIVVLCNDIHNDCWYLHR